MHKSTLTALRAGAAPLALAMAMVAGGVAISTPAAAQDVTASTLSGNVADAAGNPVSGATVEVAATDRGFSRTVTTSPSGAFTVPGLPVGTYSVTISAAGHSTTQVDDVAVQIGGSSYGFTVETSADDANVIIVSGTARRQVDFSGTATGVVLDVQDIVKTVPVARNIEAIQMLTPQVT